MTETEQQGDWRTLGRSLRAADVLTADWAAAFDAVPRSAFLPDVMWPYDTETRSSVPVSKADDPAAWQRYADANVPIVTQWDDGAHGGTDPGQVGTSSASMPSVVTAMLADLDVRPGHTVLEIGTGTGWNAGLLAHRLGDANVTTVEVDPAVAVAARSALHRAALDPTVVTGDGLAGHRPRAPYDRIIATCGMREIPYAWIEQTKPGGRVVAPWGTRYGNGDAVVGLTVADGAGSGRFTRLVEFMKLRAQRTPFVRHADHVPDGALDTAEQSVTTVRGEDFLTGAYTAVPFVLGLRVRDCVQVVADTRGDATPVWLYGLGDRSWAVVVFRDGRPESAVRQAGPRRLWDDVEAAFRWWEGHNRPAPERFGLTVSPTATRAWLDTPTHAWPL